MHFYVPHVLIFVLAGFIFLASCEQKKNQQIESPTEKMEQSTDPTAGRILTTQTGKAFEILTQSNKDGLIDIHILPKGFEHSKDTLIISGADPLSKAFVADLDQNAFDEIYLITTSVGSGSYSQIHGFSSNRDKSVTSIYIPPITEKDLTKGALYEGYMGHDSIFVDEGQLKRLFPIYLPEDPNCCPSGGQTTLLHELIAGEASWKLQAIKQ